MGLFEKEWESVLWRLCFKKVEEKMLYVGLSVRKSISVQSRVGYGKKYQIGVGELFDQNFDEVEDGN